MRGSMKKDTQFTLRMPTDLKRELEDIAAREGRSMGQICEAFLTIGSEAYKKEGAKVLQRFFLQRQKSNRPRKSDLHGGSVHTANVP
jgi:hypothetical protein